MKRIALALFALLSLATCAPVNAANVDVQLCWDGRFLPECLPRLTSPDTQNISQTSASVRVTTDFAGGTLYCLVNQTDNVDDIDALKSGPSQPVTAAGEQAFSASGLSASTGYYAHCYHDREDLGVFANLPGAAYIASTSQFTTLSQGGGGGESYRGMPAFPAWTADANVDQVYTGGGNITANGTEGNPVVISCNGANVSLPGGQIDVQGSFLTLRDCNFPNGRIRIGGNDMHFDNVNTSQEPKAGFAMNGNRIWIQNSSAIGHWAQGLDRHGFQASCGNDFIVIKDSESSGNSGDGFQAGNGCGASNRVTNIFIGGMTCNANRENCLDLKWTDNTVFTGMNSTGHGESGPGFESGSDGSSVIFGSDGGSLNAWLIDSQTDDPIGIRVEEGNGGVILGNTFSGPGGIALQKFGNPLDIRNNTSTSGTFIGNPDRAFNYLINVFGNVYTGSLPSTQSQNQMIEFNVDDNATDISDLEARFLNQFGFPLQ